MIAKCICIQISIIEFVPELKQLVDEVSTQIRLMRSNVDELAPYGQKFLTDIGCTLQLSENCLQITKQCSTDEIRTKTNQVTVKSELLAV